MAFSVLAALCVAGAVYMYTLVSSLQKNIAAARKTGLYYLVLPVCPHYRMWQLTCWIWIPLIKLLPKSLWENWIFVMKPEWGYPDGQKEFDRLGTETFLAVSPGRIILFTESAEVIHAMTQRREAFPKHVALYDILSMFGHNVLTTEGALWRLHRKATSASFNEKNAAHTFSEAITQTQGMLDMWFGPEGERTGTTKTIRSLEHDTMTWALNIIGYVGFGLRLLWPGQSLPKDIDPKLAKYGSREPPPGHTLSFADSIALTLERIIAIVVFPEFLLRILPFKFAREAYQGKTNYLTYMNEFLADKKDEALALAGHQKEGMDIMGQLVQSKYGHSTTTTKPTSTPSPSLSDSDIIGNAFIMTVAGHETTANTLHFALVELAANPAAQRRLQADIDALFPPTTSSDPSTWDYEKNVNAMLASHIGACVNETLRLMPPVTGIPKVVAQPGQKVTIDGRVHDLPGGMSCNLLAVCAQRNPRWWPTRRSERTGKGSDLDDFLPERWYRSSGEKGESGGGGEDVEDKGDYGGFQGSDTSASLYRPVRGSYLPFSDGPRSCLGRRIAMVEMNAVLAVIFQRYSIELAVEEWAGDEEVERMGREERRGLYKRAQARSREVVSQADSVLTLKLHGGRYVPVRLVKKGCERFVADPELS